jgi:hypothetical protein
VRTHQAHVAGHLAGGHGVGRVEVANEEEPRLGLLLLGGLHQVPLDPLARVVEHVVLLAQRPRGLVRRRLAQRLAVVRVDREVALVAVAPRAPTLVVVALERAVVVRAQFLAALPHLPVRVVAHAVQLCSHAVGK